MKMYLTHNENIKTFGDAMRHLELEDDRFMVVKPETDIYYAGSSSHGALASKCKRVERFMK